MAMDVLHSGDNPSFKRVRLLARDAGARRTERRAVVEGLHLVREAVAAGAQRQLWATEAAAASPEGRALLDSARGTGPSPRLLSAGLFAKLSDTPSPQGWLCEVETGFKDVPADANLLLALDSIQDPGNLGTLLRCAWATGAAVLMGRGCADAWSPKVLRAGAGAQFHTSMRESADLAADLGELSARGVRLYGTGPRAKESHLRADCALPHCWVVGSEGAGLSDSVESVCTASFRIDYPGAAESLNAAVSGAILLFEALRQRNSKKA